MTEKPSVSSLWRIVAGTGRGRVFGLILLCGMLSYLVLAFGVSLDHVPSERNFNEPPGDDARRLGVYIEVMGVDAVNDALKLRISFTQGHAAQDSGAAAAAQDIMVQLDDGDNVQALAVPVSRQSTVATFEADLNDGSIATYPLDHYIARLHIAAHASDDAPVPLRVTVWQGIAGWALDVTQSLHGAAGEMQLGLGLRRSAALTSLALAIYAEMALVAVAALTIGGLVFLRIRPPESTLTGALVGMLFALPAMRYAMPGMPPLGVRADLLVFLWAELALALGLALFVVSWAMAAIRP